MGVDFCCEDKLYSCGYGRWNSIRRAIIYATYLYVRDYNEINEPNEQVYRHDLLTMFDSCILGNAAHENAVNTVVKECHCTDNIIDSLNYFGLVGLYALCYKSDCDGFYSPGNSLDICILLDKLKETFKMYNIEPGEQRSIYNTEHGIYSVFDTSYKTLSNVWIF